MVASTELGRTVTAKAREAERERLSATEREFNHLDDDLSVLLGLQRKMKKAKKHHDNLVATLLDGVDVVEQHHASESVQNIITHREIVDLRKQIEKVEHEVREAQIDVDLAEKEHQRLHTINNELVVALSDKDAEVSRVTQRVGANTVGEKHLYGHVDKLKTRMESMSESKGDAGGLVKVFTAKLGDHHSTTFQLQSAIAELRRELEKLDNKKRFGRCANPLCQEQVQQLAKLQEEMESVRGDVVLLKRSLNMA